MKKFLLMAACAATLCANAETIDKALSFEFEGQPIEQGASCTIHERDIMGLGGDIDVYCNNGDVTVAAYLEFDGNPTSEQYNADGWGKWGMPQFCTAALGAGGVGNCFMSTDGNKTNVSGANKVDIKEPGMAFQIHLQMAPTDPDFKSQYKMRFIKLDDNSEFYCYVVFDNSASVEGLAGDNAAVEYYNLQGVRVSNPENGIFIAKQGSKVRKVALK